MADDLIRFDMVTVYEHRAPATGRPCKSTDGTMSKKITRPKEGEEPVVVSPNVWVDSALCYECGAAAIIASLAHARLF